MLQERLTKQKEGESLHKRLHIVFLSTIIVMIAVFVTGCTDTTVSRKKHYEKGLAFIKEKNYRGAIIEFRNALEKDPNFFEARYQLGVSYFETGQVDAAEKELQKALKLQPSLVDAHLYLGKIYLVKGYRDRKKLDESINEIEVYLNKKIGDTEALEVLGMVYMAKNDFEKAHSYLNQAIKNDPNKITPHITLSGLFIQEKKFDKAREEINVALSKDKKSIKTLYALCDLEKKEDRYEEATKCYMHITEIDKKEDLTSYGEIGLIQILTKRYEDAIKTAEHIISKHPNDVRGYYIKGVSS